MLAVILRDMSSGFAKDQRLGPRCISCGPRSVYSPLLHDA